MSKLRMSLVAGGLLVLGGLLASPAQAEVFAYRPLLGPRVVTRAAVTRTVVARPVVTTYSTVTPAYSVGPTYVAPAPTITTYRTVSPVVVGPVYRPIIRRGWVPAQPVRNAVRFAIR